jgi:MFS family permease
MSITFIVALGLLIGMAVVGFRVSNLPRNVWLLFVAQPLGLSSASMVVFAGGLLGGKIAPDPEYATIPLTLMILMTAAGVIPAALLMKRFGRRVGTNFGLLSALAGSLLSAYAAISASFSLLVIGAGLLGFSMAFVAQMRFAVIESLSSSKDIPKAISVLMIGSMFAAILGPEVAVLGKDVIASPHGFAGSFVGLFLMIVCAMLIVSRLAPIGVAEEKLSQNARPISQIIKQPTFIIAVCSGAIAYGVMSYIMTASPLSMHQVNGHSLEATKWVIQSHIVAMYLPSLFSALLIRHIGLNRLVMLGTFVYIAVVVVGLSGQEVAHYWWAMVLLGIGWNFLYTSGTVLLPESYQPNERFKAQATNDFSIFFIQAMASLFAGKMLFSYGWDNLVVVAVPMIILMILIAVWLNRIKLVSS